MTLKGKHPSKASREKMRKSHLGKKLPPEQKRKIGLASKGLTLSKEARRKISISHRGKKHYLFGKHMSAHAKKLQSIQRKGKKKSKATKKRMSEAQKGRYVSEVTRQKISAKLKGQILTPETRAKMSKFQKGKIVSKETAKKISITLLKLLKNPKNHPCWLGGKSFEPYGLAFNKLKRESVRQRDSYKCQMCFKRQGKLRTKTNKPYLLMIHHINYDKENNNDKNLISLCRICHMKTNFNRKYWTKYFKKKIKMIYKRLARGNG